MGNPWPAVLHLTDAQTWYFPDSLMMFLKMVTNSEQDELKINRIKIPKDLLITKDQKKNKDKELKPLFSNLMEQL